MVTTNRKTLYILYLSHPRDNSAAVFRIVNNNWLCWWCCRFSCAVRYK